MFAKLSDAEIDVLLTIRDFIEQSQFLFIDLKNLAQESRTPEFLTLKTLLKLEQKGFIKVHVSKSESLQILLDNCFLTEFLNSAGELYYV